MKAGTRRGTRRIQARAASAKPAAPPITAPPEAETLRIPPEHDEPMVTAPPRPDLRAPMREDDPRARAAARAAELRDHLGNMDEGEDKFFVDPADVPDGWEYEWKRHKLLGKEDPAYEVSLTRMGWESVPARRHPHMMPSGWAGDTIERDGMILMERPKEISDEARRIELKKARNQVRQKEEQLTQVPGKISLGDEDPRNQPRIKKSYEPMAIPEG